MDLTIPLTPNDEDMKFFVDKDTVTRLSFPESSVTDGGVQTLSGMKHLNSLALDHTDIRTLKGFSKLKNLDGLSLRSTRINDDSLLNLKGLNLHTLRLGYSKITDEGVTNLIGLPLHDLDLSHTQVTDNCSDALVTFHDMQYLGFEKTRITSTGARKIAENLRRLTNMNVKGSMITLQQQLVLEREFPTIRFRDDSVCLFDTMSTKAHKLAEADRVSEALIVFRECEGILKKRYGDDFPKTKDYVALRKFCENILKQREKNKPISK